MRAKILGTLFSIIYLFGTVFVIRRFISFFLLLVIQFSIQLSASILLLFFFHIFSDCSIDLEKLYLAKLAYGNWVLGSSQFSLLQQLSHKMTLTLPVVKRDSKIIISYRKYEVFLASDDWI